MFLHIIQQLRLLIPCPHLKIKIRPVKPRHQHLRTPKPQHTQNIVPHLLRCRRRKRTHHRPHRQLIHKLHNIQITRPEILSPLGNTVCLIHRHHTDLHPLCKIKKQRRQQPFRCHINNLIPPLHRIFHRLINLTFRKRTVNIRRMNPGLIQRPHLILHQRNQRRNHNRNPRQKQRRNLITNRLPRPRRHNPQNIPPG